jgi:hypothetical protein
MEYTFFVKGGHRTETVSSDHILKAAKDAAWLLNLKEYDHLLWLSPLPPLRSGAAKRNVPPPVEMVVPKGAEREDMRSVTLDMVNLGRSYFPLFLEHAEQDWHMWHHRGVNDAVRLRYTLMVCGAIDAITSAEALEQIRAHLLVTSEMPSEVMPPAFEGVLQELVSLQGIFNAPYERLSFLLFLQVLALTCLAVPLEQVALDQLREALTPIEQHCSMQLRKIEAEQEVEL